MENQHFYNLFYFYLRHLRKKNISNLILSSDRGFVDLGLFTDVVYKQEHAGTFSFDISSVTDKGDLHKLHTLYLRYGITFSWRLYYIKRKK